ncbi:polysialyltransferase family glycosyltransferase [Vibrio lentus]
MNIYVCSTLRHFLFSISKSCYQPSEHSTILFFYDYQGIDKNKINKNIKSENIEIILISRKELTHKLKKSWLGKLTLFLSMRNIQPNEQLIKLVSYQLIKLKILKPSDFNNLSLFIFNDKNKVARIFKLLIKNYEIIEDGVGNYYKIPKKGISKYLNPINLKGLNTWVMGESKRCTTINVVWPEKLPISVREKGKAIEFLGKSEGLPSINTVFKFTPKLVNVQNNIVIIATQPLSSNLANMLKDEDYFFYIHQCIARYMESEGKPYFIKLHPSEDIKNYLPYFDEDKFLSVKHPLELELLNSPKKVIVASINSTAGLGFEQFCERRKLIRDEEMGHFNEQIISWKDNPSILKERLEEAFSFL